MPRRWTIFMLLKATTDWLAHSPAQRFELTGAVLEPLLERHADVRLRFFDAEYFSAGISDVALWETENLDAWRSLVEGLRETPFWGRWFEVRELLLTCENGYAEHYGQIAISG